MILVVTMMGTAIWLFAWRNDRRRKSVLTGRGFLRLLVDLSLRATTPHSGGSAAVSLNSILPINPVVDVPYAAINPAIRYK